MTIATHHIDAFAGTVLAPGDHGWDAARQAFNTDIDQQPAAIAMPADAVDVASALRFATRHGLRVAPQRTGHNAGPLGDLRDVLLLKTDALDGVEIDAGARRVRVGAATRWEQVTPRLSELGLAALHGSSPDVGIVGYSLGGGIGWLARKHGMQTNAVTAIELVTADGRFVRTDHEHEPELFWALRGGGGNFGVVTAIEFEVLPVRELYAGALFYRARADRRRPAHVDRAAAAPARGDHLVGQRPALPAAAGAPRGDPRALVRGRDGRVPRLRGRRARAAAAAAPAVPRAGHLRDPAAGRAQRAGDGPPRAAALPQRPRADRGAAGGRDRGRGPDRRPGLVAHAGAAAPHGRRPRPPRAGRGSAGDAPRRDLRVRPRGRPGRGHGAGRPVGARQRSRPPWPRSAWATTRTSSRTPWT